LSTGVRQGIANTRDRPDQRQGDSARLAAAVYAYRQLGTLPRHRSDFERLRERGIWLLDASVHAIHSPNGQRLSRGVKCELHESWWKHYGRRVIEDMPGAKLWALGKTVNDDLSPVIRQSNLDFLGWIYQPQAARRPLNMEQGWPELLKDVNSAG
jgi:hypothetical protein